MNLLSFVNLFNMSMRGVFVIGAVLIIRLLFGKRSAKERMPLWALAGISLIIPMFITSPRSIVPRSATHLGETAVAAAIESAEGARTGIADSGLGTVIIGIFLAVWSLGVCLMIVYAVISTHRLKQRLAESVMIRPGIWTCDRIGTPFVFGLGNPKLYVPSSITGDELDYVISHEITHIRRHDHWWKPVAFVILVMHWFNPLVWAGYIAFGRDVELACDEATTCWRGYEERKAYANVLINCSAEKSVGVCPVAFGGGNIKSRVESVLRNAEPKILVIILLCIILLFGFCAGPVDKTDGCPGLWGEIYGKTTAMYMNEELNYTPGKKKWSYIDTREVGFERDGDKVTAYLWVLYELYHYEDGDVVCDFSRRNPVRVTAQKTDNGFDIVEYLIPDNEYIRQEFPLSVRSRMLYFDTLEDEQRAHCLYQAKKEIVPLYKKMAQND